MIVVAYFINRIVSLYVDSTLLSCIQMNRAGVLTVPLRKMIGATALLTTVSKFFAEAAAYAITVKCH